jgi:hypothetical protein
MSEPVTEIAYIPLKASTDLEKDSAKNIWHATLKTIAQQNGAKKVRWGVKIENPGVAQLAIGKLAFPWIWLVLSHSSEARNIMWA